MGDFNITSLQEPIENQIHASVLRDAWIEMGCPPEIKYTYDYQQNSHIKGRFRVRTDRNLYVFQFD